MWTCACGRDWPEWTQICWCGKAQPKTKPLQAMYLKRLADMLKTQKDLTDVRILYRLSAEDWRTKLLNKAIFSTLRDCESLGMGKEARELMKGRGH